MQSFQDTFKTFINAFLICMTVSINAKLKVTRTFCILNSNDID